jgi:transposase
MPIPDLLGTPRKGEKTDHADYLNLPGLISDPSIVEGKCVIRVKAEQIRVPLYPDCACLIKEVKPHSPFIMDDVYDTPDARKSVIIEIKRWRWMCKSCKKKTVTQPLKCMAEGHYRMMRRLLEYLEVQSLLGAELKLSRETGVFVRTIREIREKFVERLKDEVKFDTPRVLGMDGVRADSNRRRVNLTDIEAGFVLGLLKSGNSKSIAIRLRKFPGWEKIQIVTIDMCKALRAAVLEALPDAVIVIDRFHVIKTANQVMDKVRNRLFPRDKKKREPGQPFRPRPEPFRMRRADLKGCHLNHMEYWFNRSPELRLAYNLKEDFLEIFDEETYGGELLMCKATASEYYQEWLRKFPARKEYSELYKDFKKIFSQMKNWGEHIFNYFDYKYTNAFTESMNRKIRDILRDARGCKFETICARIVYGTYLMKQQDADRKLEISHHSKRKRCRQPNTKSKGKSAAEGKAEETRRSHGYELPDLRQMSFDFTNPATPLPS